MNTPNPALHLKIEATGGVLRPCARLPRPIPYPPELPIGPLGGSR